MNAKTRVVGVVVLVLVVGVAGWMLFRPRNQQPVKDDGHARVNRQDDQNREVRVDAGRVMAGNTGRKANIQSAKPSDKSKTANSALPRDPSDYGKLPAIKPDANPQVKAVVEAIRQKKHLDRLSALGTPAPFDAKAYHADPSAYLSQVEVGRVFQVAQPGPGVQRLRAVSSNFHRVTQGESVMLRVSAPAGAPVSFASFDCGQFDNQLTAITVAASKDGEAEVRFTATTGTIDDIHILAGSPLASGQVRFVVNVSVATAGNTVKVAGVAQGKP
jgi:hypothetical protein